MVDNKIDVNITNKLELVAEASPAMVVKAIDEMQNALVIEKGKVTEKDKALTIANKAKDELQTKYDDLVKDMEEIKSEMEEQEAEDRLKSATDMVNGFADAGKILNTADEIKVWVDDASTSKERFEWVKNRLTNMPVNKEAKKMEVVTTLGGVTGGPKNLAMKMHAIANKHKQK